jgi:16S rRNA (adenine1518-N6/adenine1519-N6)-dimethyltransferase
MSQIHLLKKFGLSIRGVRGQHLLVDENIQRKLANSVDSKRGDHLVEIGPGLGAITKFLLPSRARVVVIESDRKFVEILRQEFQTQYSNLEILHQDVLKTDFKKLSQNNKKLTIVSNMPYYITTPILLLLIKNRDLVSSAFLTVQREIADRIFAVLGTKEYGRLSILVGYYADATRLFEISRNCFLPQPEVDSTTIKFTFTPRPAKPFQDDLFFDLVQAGFAKRRKNILNALSDGLAQPGKRVQLTKLEVRALLEEVGISLNERAENLRIADFSRLAEAVTRTKS